MKKIKRVLSLVLVFCLMCTTMVTGFAADTTSTTTGQADFMKVVHLDAGRKYFSVDNIKKIIDNASADGYNYLELGVGNDGLRFLLDDMSVTVEGKAYSSDAVKSGIQTGNKNYYDAGTNELTQNEMDEIIGYAQSKNISIIPLINSPGHMDAIIDCMESLGMKDVAYNHSARTIDVTNTTAVAFTQALIQKYVNYFADKGSKYFNMGADEYANDVYKNVDGMGFGHLQTNNKYSYFVTYVNKMATMIEDAGMTPMAFNDGIYYDKNTSSGTFDKKILVSYWSSGWGSYSLASASFLASQGLKILNTNDAWYYVLGRQAGNSSGYTIATAKNGVQNTKYNDVPGDNDPTPVGSMICVWCDTPSVAYNSNEESNIADLMQTFASNNPEVFAASNSGSSKPSKAPSKLEGTTITVPVGSSAERLVSGSDLSAGDYTTADPSIATVTAEYKAGTSESKLQEVTSIESGKQYLIVNQRKETLLTNTSDSSWKDSYSGLKLDGTALPESTALWTITGSNGSYTAQYSGGNYLTIGRNSTSTTSSSANLTLSYSSTNGLKNYTGYWNISQSGYYLNNLGSTTCAGGWNGNDASIDDGSKWTLYEIVTENQTGTTFTFTGNQVGTTTVTISGVEYTINVVDKAPDGALDSDSIDLEYWITNFKVYDTESTSGNQKYTITKDTKGVNTEAGVDVSTLAVETGHSNFDNWKEVHYWQTMRLDADNQQTTDSGDDETADGTTLTHIRNLNGGWQYQTLTGDWNYFQSDDQLVAYYLQKTDVTKEITTYAKDWGYSTSDTTQDTSGGKGQVALTVAVVYPDGTVSPAEGSMYSQSTTIFNYWDGRDIGIISPKNNSDYDISKITVTDGTRNSNTSSNTWGTSDSITWDKTTNSAGSEWYDETTVWDETTDAGTTPVVNGKQSDITWSAKSTAKLVLIYLKPVVKETNLNVVYWDDSINAQINKNDIQVAMTYNQGDSQPSFVTSLKQESEVHVGEFTLDDDAYVTNSSGINQTFNKDITVLPNVDTKYQTGLYQYQKAEISADGKTLTLHYSVDNSKIAASYVVDFGKSVNVPIGDILTGEAAKKKIKNMKFETSYGKADVGSGQDNSITFTPTSIMTMPVVVTATIIFDDGSQVSPKIAFVPASNVMYEEDFVNKGEDWTTIGTARTDNQKKEVLGKEDIHGYDASYDNDSQFSNGSAYQAQLTLEKGKDFVKTQDKATFTFTGTGFDLISECGTNTGIVSVVVKDADGKTVKSYMVDTYFTGDEKGIISGTGILDYQVPIVRCTGLAQGTYTVETRGYLTDGSGVVAKTAEETTENGEVSEQTIAEVLDDMNIKNVDASEVEATCMDDNSVLLGGTGVAETAAKSRSARAAATTSANVYIDGVRVYNTLNNTNGAMNYVKSEQKTTYASVYDFVKNSLDANGTWTDNAMVYTEYNGETDISSIAEYKQQGPENEVYLAPGSEVAFALKNYQKDDTVQVAMKAVNDDVTVESDMMDTDLLATATEMYYNLKPEYDKDLEAYVVEIGNSSESEGVLSLSNLKLSSGITVSSNQALADKVIEEDNTKPAFTPKTFTVSVPANTLKVGKSSVIKVKASTDVAHVYMVENDKEPVELTANNKNAVANGKQDLYSYSKTIKTKGSNALDEDTYKYSIYATDKDGNQSKSVDFTVTIEK